MAAGALCEVLGGSVSQVENAAEIGDGAPPRSHLRPRSEASCRCRASSATPWAR
ncbi:hypothetical protein [Pseudomonas sp. 10S4]|uniref:hypothetical protein n=1 Tax=Pseudomonas sp. 10S4 TaxID=3048583 RepID=UPI003A0FDF7A